jgi:crossover junction endodeoxyribonuclease RuvC
MVEGRGTRLIHLAHGAIRTPAGMAFQQRLDRIYVEMRALIEAHRPDGISIEQLYFSKNVTTGIAVAQARGVIALAAAHAGLSIGEFSPREVKAAITGNGAADKRQMQAMIKVLLNLDAAPKPDDAADALGIAICQIHAGKFRAVVGE